DDLTPATRENVSLEELERSWMSRLPGDCVFISARTGAGVDKLRQLLYERAREIHLTRFPYNDFLYQTYTDME
ncbi:MAG: GTPase HflX, partial [Duncaniella sp.]|nr:GTPase HflX [Duncaniella sp.]